MGQDAPSFEYSITKNTTVRVVRVGKICPTVNALKIKKNIPDKVGTTHKRTIRDFLPNVL